MAESNPMLSLDALTFQSSRSALEQGCAAIAAGETVSDGPDHVFEISWSTPYSAASF